MTESLYLTDCYLKETDATVTRAEGSSITLDRTVFYPGGGGQACDIGTIGGCKVVSVEKKDGEILHNVEGGIAVGDAVHCAIDWQRRYALMKLHSASHTLAAMLYKTGALITGNQIEPEYARFDFSTERFERAAFEKAVADANALFVQNIPVKTYFLPRDEAMRIPGVVKLANALPPSAATLRIVEIEGIDAQADGGTHVRCLKEVRGIEITNMENKGKNNRRIYFKLRG